MEVSDSSRFDEYEAQVRREYAWVADDVFRVRRRAVLQRLLERPSIHGTTRFRERLGSGRGRICNARCSSSMADSAWKETVP